MGEWGLAWWCALIFTATPLLALVLWHCTDVFHRAAFTLNPAHRGRRLPPGHMGIPVLGESAAMMWYFKVARRPDGFVEAKRKAYGEGSNIYRTHLFGSPAVIVCSPAANKFVLQSTDSFAGRWPMPELLGLTSLPNIEGRQHTRLRGCIVAAVNQPEPLRTFARMVQPRVEAALRTWADKGTIIAVPEMKKVMFGNICKTFISLDPSPFTEKMEKLFVGLVDGIMAFPLNIPGTASHHGLMCRRKLNAVFREELERRRAKKTTAATLGDRQQEDGDLMSRLMETQDEQGKKLSDDEVVDSIGSLVMAAYESTATAAMWASYHLAKSPDILAKLREPAKPGTYRPFGGGYRACAGNMMARLQITIMLYHLSLGCEWKLLNPNARTVYFPTPRPEDNAPMAFSRLCTSM
ncbi:hypothetical protein CFC21_085883 [Triticum aestivum]|uniref:Uncharacterized protein n=2 Tax=Triticum aestivum TaxID=4565 RepID=A0A9R1ID47_WHEAT|nr:hypothetical protein CFC21_085883 [Triticum aestivum]